MLQLRDQVWELRGRLKQLLKSKIHLLYKFTLSPTSKKLKNAKTEKQRELIKRNYTKLRIEALLEDGKFLCEPVGEEEVRT